MQRLVFQLVVPFLFLLPLSLESQIMPWGKDATLAYTCRERKKRRPSPLAELAGRLILFHREVISPSDGPRSHFWPSSSQYTLESMYRDGFFLGFLAGCDRLMRENKDPWIYPLTLNPKGELIKSDPVLIDR